MAEFRQVDGHLHRNFRVGFTHRCNPCNRRGVVAFTSEKSGVDFRLLATILYRHPPLPRTISTSSHSPMNSGVSALTLTSTRFCARPALSALTLANTPIPLRKVSTAAVRAMPSYFARRRSSPPIVAGRPFSPHSRVTTLLSAKIAL